MNEASKSEQVSWDDLRDAIEKMVAYPPGLNWHVPRDVADRALEAMRRYEKNGYPVPRLLPSEDTMLELTWRNGGWSIYHVFGNDGEDYMDAHWFDRTPTRAEAATPEKETQK